MLKSLVQQILLPTAAGLALRSALPPLRTWIDANRKQVAQLSTAVLATVPWMQVSQTAANPPPDLSSSAIAITAALAVGIHLVYVLFNTGAAAALRLGGSDQKIRRALIITTSQKTMPVAVVVVGK